MLPDTQPRNSESRRGFFVLLGLLALSIVLSQIYKAQLLDLFDDTPIATQITPPPCDLNRQACVLPILTPVVSEKPWSFEITPRPIPVSAPLTLTLTPPAHILPENHPEAVWVDLTGDDMDMGIIRIPLAHTAEGQWQGSGSIPICVTGQMRWRARLTMELKHTTLQTEWVFTAPVTAKMHVRGL